MPDLAKIYLNGVDVSGLTEINLDGAAPYAGSFDNYKPGGFIADDGVLFGRPSYERSSDRGMDGPPVPWEEFFKRFSYKPNFTFEYDARCNKEYLKIRMMVQDSRPGLGDMIIPVQKNICLSPFDAYPTLREQCMEIYYELLSAETHECGEWFRFDEQLPFDPHKNESA